MRDLIAIVEEWCHQTKHGVDVFKNPSRQELMREIQKDEYGQVRCIVLPEDLYVFSTDIIHLACADSLGLSHDIIGRIFLDKKGPFINRDDDIATVGKPGGSENLWNIQQRENVDRYCVDHPILSRLYPNYVLEVR
jgi:hypothetical protein